MTTTVIPKATWRGVVRKRTFDARDIDDVILVLRQLAHERHTGPVTYTVHMAQGGFNGVVAEERAALDT